MAGSIRSGFVNIAKNAAAGAASKFVSSVADSLKSGLGGSSSSSASSPLQSSFNVKAKPILMYPASLGVDARQANYIMFTPWAVENAKLKPTKSNIAPSGGANADFGGVDNAAAAGAANAAESARIRKGSNPSSSLFLNNRTITRSGRTMALYMPPALNVSYGMEYAESEIGGMSEIMYEVFKGYQSASGSMLDRAESALKQLGAGATPEVLRGMALKTLSAAPGMQGAKDIYAMETGAIITPKMELMFRGVSRRQFSFKFTFMPEDKMDGLTVNEIITEFKLRMHPEFKSGTISRLQTIPDIFEIAYWNTFGPNLNLHKIGKCFLEKVDVVYGGDKFQAFQGDDDDMNGAPIRTELSLQFREIELLDRNKITDGF